jgi:hypothetical protein
MPSIFESITQAISPDIANQFAKVTGLQDPQVNRGLSVAGPVVTGSLARRAAGGLSLNNLFGMLPQEGSGSGLGNLLGMAGGGAALSGLFSGIFGSGLGSIGRSIDKRLGFRASSLLPLAAPLILGVIRKFASSNKLDEAGLTRTLQDEQKSFLAKGGDTAEIIRGALDAGERADVTREHYTPEQWSRIRLAPVAAAKLVMMASPSGAVGALKEAIAVPKVLKELKEEAPANSVVDVAFDAELTREELEEIGNDRPAVLAVIESAWQAVRARDPQDTKSYSDLLRGVATKVAEASKEGGFLGIGGTKVSKEEQAAVDEIKALTTN